MKAIILEDNISDVWTYEIVLKKLQVQVVGKFKSWKDSISLIKKELPDFLIVDLQLNNKESGIEFIDQMDKYQIPVIICTAFPKEQYVDFALAQGVKAFVTKPIDKVSLEFQIRRVIDDINKQDSYLVVKDKNILIRVPIREIYKIEIEGNYSYVYVSKSKKYVVRMSLTKLKMKLNEKKFMRCHRSTLVNIDFIDSINVIENKILLSNQETVALGSKYKSIIKAAFTKNNS